MLEQSIHAFLLLLVSLSSFVVTRVRARLCRCDVTRCEEQRALARARPPDVDARHEHETSYETSHNQTGWQQRAWGDDFCAILSRPS